jgi:hypothetical protein
MPSELGHIRALIAGACCIREHEDDLNIETTLLSLAEKKVEIAKKIVQAMIRASPTGERKGQSNRVTRDAAGVACLAVLAN